MPNTSDNPTRVADGSLLVLVQLCLGDRKVDYRNKPTDPPFSGSNISAFTMTVFRSVDEGHVWEFQGVVTDPRDYPESVEGTDSEMALTQLADNKTLTVVTRSDGDCGCVPTAPADLLPGQVTGGSYGACGFYHYYYQTFSTDFGKTWTKAKPMVRLSYPQCLLWYYCL